MERREQKICNKSLYKIHTRGENVYKHNNKSHGKGKYRYHENMSKKRIAHTNEQQRDH